MKSLGIERVFRHHDEWEDHKAGMYAVRYDDPEAGAELARALLADVGDLYAAMSAVTREWPVASEVNLTHVSSNRQAWLGQAACCFACGVPDDVTKQGWHKLTGWQQDAANAVADRVIDEWEAVYHAEGTLWGGGV